ncbi:hypothetical protein U9M48_005323 [Paspalum notatum var. saurae]|uniref:Disease resistance RPP13-like protein 1 n=1 Tax=Paspalum notatum var. saurae TaxID=547442 RepID=A0AAQ3SJT5_PASNO
MAPAAALVFAGKSVAIPAISFLVTKAFNYLNEYFKADGYDEIWLRLEQALPKIQAVFQVINPQRIKEESSALDAWLRQLRNAYEEAEDAIDEVEYYKLKEKAEDHKVSDWGSSFAKIKHRAIRSVMHASVLDKTIKGFTHRGTLKRLRKAVEGLDKAASGAMGFLALADHLRGSSTSCQEEDILNKDRETGSMITAPKVFGLQDDLERLVGWLTKPSVGDAEIEESSNVSVISIVGHGGMGKTTLAQLVHNDDTINSQFDKVIWACASTIFNAKDVICKILENAGWQTVDASTLESSQRILGDKLSFVIFLLILDDVWEDKKDDQWEKLLAPLRKGKNGCKILLTTRIKRAAEMAENVNYHIRRIKGYNISVLKDLGSLRSLSVKGLENVDSQEEAKEANMKSKKYLESLQILNCQKLTETRLSLASEVSDYHEESRRFLQIQTISIDQPSLLFVEPLKSLCPTDRLDIGDGSETLDPPVILFAHHMCPCSSSASLLLNWLHSLEADLVSRGTGAGAFPMLRRGVCQVVRIASLLLVFLEEIEDVVVMTAGRAAIISRVGA